MHFKRLMLMSLRHKKIIIYLILFMFVYITVVVNKLYTPSSEGFIRNQLIGKEAKICLTPNYKAMDAEVRPYLKYNHYRCPKIGPDLIAVDLSTIYQIPQVFLNFSQLNCFYKTDDVWKPFVRSVEIENSFFVHVKCMHLKKIVYRDYLPLVPKAGRKLHMEGLNVMVILIGSVSRMAFNRRMQLTKKVLHRVQAVELKNFNVVGLQKEDNFIALSSSCPYYYPQCKEEYIWDLYKEKGYSTAFIEDAIDHTYNITRKGYFVDYDWTKGNEIESLFGSNWLNGPHPFCLRNKKTHSVLLDHSKNILERGRRSNVKTFAWLYTNAAQSGEDKLNSMDAEFANYLFYLYRAGYLNETVIFFGSDQGVTFGSMYPNYQRAFMESVNPFQYILLPPWFKEVYETAYNNLIVNTHSLISPLNIHNTLKRLLDLNSLSNNSTKNLHLFQKVPEHGKFVDHGIAPEFKPCLPFEISIDHVLALSSVMETLRYINRELRHTACRHLTLNFVESARVVYNDGNLLYVVRFYAVQGSAHFETYVFQGNIIRNIIRLGYNREGKCVKDPFLKKICICKNAYN